MIPRLLTLMMFIKSCKSIFKNNSHGALVFLKFHKLSSRKLADSRRIHQFCAILNVKTFGAPHLNKLNGEWRRAKDESFFVS